MCSPSPGGGVTISSDSATSTTNQVSEDLGDFVEDPNPIDDMIEDVEEEYDKLGDKGDQLASDAQDAADALTDELTNVITNTNVIGANAANEIRKILGVKNSTQGSPGQGEAIMEGDPRLLSLQARRRKARRKGKAQLRKGGGLYIPVGSGLQVPA